MSGPRIAYVMEQTLGSVTHYENLRRHESESPGQAPLWLPIEYRESRTPWTVAGSLATRRALAPVLPEVNGIFVHTTTLAALSVDCWRKKPTVLSTDGTPLNKREMRKAYGLGPEGQLAGRAKRLLYRNVFAQATGFVGWSEWTKGSFVEDYGCREADVAVIPPGIDLDQFTAGDRDHERPRILFVGGNFERKGGELLLRVHQQRFAERADLVIVTRDEVPEAPGVRVHRNVGTNSPVLRELYATSDLFVLPTRADCYSLVGMEALAAGMPVITTRVGGVGEVVRDGETGFAVEVDDEAGLGDAIEVLVKDASRRQQMGLAGRADAAKRFDARINARRLFEFVQSRS